MLLLLILLSGASLQAQAQTPDALFKKISAAIKSGNAQLLSTHFNSTVEVTLPDADKTYSAKQATFVLKDFFAKHSVQRFQVMHNGHSGATHYETGMLVTAKGEFDTNIFVKKIGDKFLITQIRFEAE